MNNPLDAIRNMYSQLDYYRFCEYMDFNPDYDMRYWEQFQKLVDGLCSFDDKRIQKMLDYGRNDVQPNQSLR